MPLHRHNEIGSIDKFIRLMKAGLKIALISDAGTPTISDPGYNLVNIAIKQGIDVKGLSGPSSITIVAQ